ncbi:lysozyme precursor [Tribolium castaneum]|nr:lysozyme precursor [Tribolium castaneum]|eukprot:NP_001159495.1 lysozyme precursor [Tribolium castaneum]
MAELFVLFLVAITFVECKVYDRCELARELKHVHKFPGHQIATWVCIAKHESTFNTSAVNRGSGDHGLFQISDLFWCSPPGNGYACNAPCSAFEDDDITDDIACVRRIFKEHSVLSGNGFNAWAVYPLYCKQDASKYIEGCFDNEIDSNISGTTTTTSPDVDDVKAKIFERCELAKELKKNHLPGTQLATWMCIAKYESHYNTAAINTQTGDHGLFQISQIYWCSNSNKPGKGCNAKCSEFRDNDIRDDVACVKKIYKEHQRLSGNGFNAWVAYKKYCTGNNDHFIKGYKNLRVNISKSKMNPLSKLLVLLFVSLCVSLQIEAKVFKRCELAKELKNKHHIPGNQLATWMCIANYESGFNTAAINKKTGDHGLFQISQIYWCSNSNKPGKACNAKCSDFRNNDIKDDVACVKKIYNEHQKLSGNGFNAWVAYKKYCRGNNNNNLSTVAKMKLLAVVAIFAFASLSEAKIFDKCEFANTIRGYGLFPAEHISTWVCIANYESAFNTDATNTVTGDHGIYQISQIYWCSTGDSPGGGCNKRCADFHNDDISDDSVCAKAIFDEHQRLSGNGFNAWTTYAPYCSGDNSGWIAGC